MKLYFIYICACFVVGQKVTVSLFYVVKVQMYMFVCFVFCVCKCICLCLFLCVFFFVICSYKDKLTCVIACQHLYR